MLGLGVGAAHARACLAHPACELAAVCDVSDERLTEFAAACPQARTTRRAEDVLTDPRIDVVSIATYDDCHAGQVLTAIEHGKHVFAEKPLCLTAGEARRIRAALERRCGVRLSSNLVLRTSPRFADVKRRIEAGELGELFCIEGDYLYGRLHKITHGWRGRIRRYSVVLGGAIHLVDLMLWLSGRRIVEVCAFGNQVASRGTQFRFNDAVVAVLRFEDGLIGKVGVSYGCMRPHFHALRVFGTGGTFVNDEPAARLYHSRDPQQAPQRIETAYPGVDKGALLAAFVDALVRGAPPPVDERAVFESLSVCLAIERSVAIGRSVEVEYL